MGDDDYEALREKNIAERKAVFAELFNDLKKETEEIKSLQNIFDSNEDDVENQPPQKRRRTVENRRWAIKQKKSQMVFRKKYNTRSKSRYSMSDVSNELENDEALSESRNKNSKLRVIFPWDKSKFNSFYLENEQNNSDDDTSDFEYNASKKTQIIAKSEYDPNNIPSVDEITDEMLDNIAEKSTIKVYNKELGTSCHQCRQKTIDTKTVCRSGECIGVRGQFCGPCLKGRYGESAAKALKDPNWACPPCRGLCNCSICRTKSGLRPTGILAPIVKEEGFSSVMDYLQSKEQ